VHTKFDIYVLIVLNTNTWPMSINIINNITLCSIGIFVKLAITLARSSLLPLLNDCIISLRGWFGPQNSPLFNWSAPHWPIKVSCSIW
jgi:hypothetical protein